ncbi:MAG TPA: aldehyde ferredoxin oxidoreductase N-terminal domain-containing protein, partial [Dehalococcoidales bacterium]|nr:aldehyde ferredoxin oxidoreductase N-terminal domain-containing protein [Dehalococcoidales bacterium]
MVDGYHGKILAVDLTNQKINIEELDQTNIRDYVGGSGFAIPWLYRDVPPGVEWNSPENNIYFAVGPLTGTVGGTGTFSVATKGPMTNGAVSVQANGFLGAYLKFAGFDAIIVRGSSPKWVYLYVHDGTAELRDATELLGKDTWQTQDMITTQLGKTERQLSVQSIGPAGEHMVRFACIAGDRGHVAAHGGVGAVMGSKKLKALAVERGNASWPLHSKETLREISLKALEITKVKSGQDYFHWGTTLAIVGLEPMGLLPCKNYNESKFVAGEKFYGKNLRPLLKERRHPCWACQHHHCSIVEITEGPYAGFIGEEPEYEGFAAMGSVTDQRDPFAAIVLCNEADRYGIDVNESGFLLSWLMECYEKGLVTKKDTDGIDITWGNAEAMRALMKKIAYREGFGNILAEGVMRAAKTIGGEADDIAIYTTRGNIVRGHDHRR